MKTLLIAAAIAFIATAVSAQDKSLTEKNIRRAYDLLNNRDFDSFSLMVSENMIEHTPFPGQKQGLQGMKDAFEILFGAFPDLRFEVKDVIISDDLSRASVLVRLTGTNKGEWMGMKPVNRSIDIMGIDWLIFSGGKVSEHYGFMDTDMMSQQLGMAKQ
ncbi:MAG: ester cyclase [Ignavibacteria bacterium]|nr:ester cyclase [Ignavibacteria bacterium]